MLSDSFKCLIASSIVSADDTSNCTCWKGSSVMDFWNDDDCLGIVTTDLNSPPKSYLAGSGRFLFWWLCYSFLIHLVPFAVVGLSIVLDSLDSRFNIKLKLGSGFSIVVLRIYLYQGVDLGRVQLFDCP